MPKLLHVAVAVVILAGVIAFTAVGGHGSESSTHCVVGGEAASAFWFTERVWSGAVPLGGRKGPHFRVDVPLPDATWGIKEVLFSALDSARPVMRPIYESVDRRLVGGAESTGVLLTRNDDAVIVAFPKVEGSEWVMAAINFKVSRATIAIVSSGSVAVGGSLRTADCR